ncbi:preprotein translocase subunit SecE [Lactococcus termiticola]|uniref:Preprotein translocase subunit SecE n=1 Tax=Lactococcus termiticola TaxID=2169526 RepID=A0A2R5HEL2_9LACT|nr:preprotein translocase subunit SecE [Lactococcus termiticola]GBG96489.1 preprotein translocase subunit SecE [Lactococcus termiticola]
MKFIKSIGQELKLTTWPTGKESIRDFFQVLEYAIFMLFFIAIFDWISQHGLLAIVHWLLPFTK